MVYKPLPNKKYHIIYADPPWHYHNYAGNKESRWVGKEYDLMSVEDICNLPVQNITDDDCVLFLWVTPPCLLDGLKVLEAWGFEYKTKGFCWVKKNKVADSWFWGMGYWTRSNSEDCLIGIKGKPKRINASVHQVIDTKWEAHSKKPDIVREKIVELIGDVPRIELFARPTSANISSFGGWDIWGSEYTFISGETK